MNQAGILSLTRSIPNYFGSQRAGNIDFNLVGRWNDFPLVPVPLHFLIFLVSIWMPDVAILSKFVSNTHLSLGKRKELKLQVN